MPFLQVRATTGLEIHLDTKIRTAATIPAFLWRTTESATMEVQARLSSSVIQVRIAPTARNHRPPRARSACRYLTNVKTQTSPTLHLSAMYLPENDTTCTTRHFRALRALHQQLHPPKPRLRHLQLHQRPNPRDLNSGFCMVASAQLPQHSLSWRGLAGTSSSACLTKCQAMSSTDLLPLDVRRGMCTPLLEASVMETPLHASACPNGVYTFRPSLKYINTT